MSVVITSSPTSPGATGETPASPGRGAELRSDPARLAGERQRAHEAFGAELAVYGEGDRLLAAGGVLDGRQHLAGEEVVVARPDGRRRPRR